MPTEQEHLAQAERNQAFFDDLSHSGRSLEWQVTILFYTALHLVDACLSRSGIHPHSHGERKTRIRKHPRLRSIFREYSDLEDRSRDARYNAVAFDASTVQALHDNQFSTIERLVRELLKAP